MRIFEPREGHHRPRHNLTRRGEVSVERARIPYQSGRPIGRRILEVRNHPRMAPDNAEQAGTDDVPPWFRGVAYTALRLEDPRTSRGVLRIRGDSQSIDGDKYQPTQSRASHAYGPFLRSATDAPHAHSAAFRARDAAS